MNKQSQIIKTINNLDINAEAEEDFFGVTVGFYCPMGRQQMLATFHGDAEPERVAIVCQAIRGAIDTGTF
ncbi:hypothetical protein UFOVP728_32 [uncultured Caudovirales phage]|uniref:Uncharacterized protein n=1 Tax=uncultured Caudovirales phage TaxID=2100421 RepID=A0A6J5NVN5_9CAUD|nr:hypothetical protein UFOVP728_32 [uncultured Caudovirales phage]